MRKLYDRHRQKINYLLVGGWNTVVGYLVFVSLYYLLVASVHYLLIWLVSNVISITNAYIGYKLFVFKTRGNYLREYLRFYLVYGVSMALNVVFLALCVEQFKLSPPVVQAGWLFINVIISYYGHKHFSFSA
ncbi:MAG: GtrA family protein [Candidatus Margulisbacteria bacterium]|nr:GtrA family protein [Candidatus Margulisiibacteriota bacterium]